MALDFCENEKLICCGLNSIKQISDAGLQLIRPNEVHNKLSVVEQMRTISSERFAKVTKTEKDEKTAPLNNDEKEDVDLFYHSNSNETQSWCDLFSLNDSPHDTSLHNKTIEYKEREARQPPKVDDCNNTNYNENLGLFHQLNANTCCDSFSSIDFDYQSPRYVFLYFFCSL